MSNATTISAVLNKRPKEPGHAYRCFLLWAMQSETLRSVRAAGRAMGRGDSTVRMWRRKYDWDERAVDPNSDMMAAKLYFDKYHRTYKMKEVVNIQQNMTVTYSLMVPKEKKAPPTPAERIPSVTDIVDSQLDAQVAVQESPESKRVKKLQTLADGMLVTLAKAVSEGKVVPKFNDLNGLVRTVALIKQLSVDEFDPTAVSEIPHVQESMRVKQAREVRGDVVGAMIEDTQELLMILKAMRDHRDASNVVVFPGVVTATE